MYFDAVVDKKLQPIFNSTPEKVASWLKNCDDISEFDVCIGKTLNVVPASKYLELAR